MRLQKSGIVFSGRLSLQAWELLGKQLMSCSSAASWWIADWLVYGEASFKDRYREAIEKTSLNYQTLRNYNWIARQFDLSRRRDGLSFGHHAEVASLDQPEQDYWLRKSEELGWSRNRLRNEVRASLRQRQNGQCRNSLDNGAEMTESHSTVGKLDSSDGHSQPDIGSLRLNLHPDDFARCEAAACDLDLTVERWAALVLVAVAEGRQPVVGSKDVP
jgi:hypothetical protein